MPISKTITEAIQKIIDECPSLKKADTNTHQNYKFVSIDDYYSTVPAIAGKNGINWTIRETDIGIITDKLVRITYQFGVYHKDGDGLPDFSRVTIVHQISGAQTAMSAAAYAEKWFMRTTFKIPSGEEDADATDQKTVSAKGYEKATEENPASKSATSSPVSQRSSMATEKKALQQESTSSGQPSSFPGDANYNPRAGVELPTGIAADPKLWALVRETFEKLMISQCETTSELAELSSLNQGVLKQMEKEAPEEHARVRQSAKDRAALLKKSASSQGEKS